MIPIQQNIFIRSQCFSQQHRTGSLASCLHVPSPHHRLQNYFWSALLHQSELRSSCSLISFHFSSASHFFVSDSLLYFFSPNLLHLHSSSSSHMLWNSPVLVPLLLLKDLLWDGIDQHKVGHLPEDREEAQPFRLSTTSSFAALLLLQTWTRVPDRCPRCVSVHVFILIRSTGNTFMRESIINTNSFSVLTQYIFHAGHFLC